MRPEPLPSMEDVMTQYLSRKGVSRHGIPAGRDMLIMIR
jgi:hypothetical protein